MKPFLLILAVVVVGCGKKEEKKAVKAKAATEVKTTSEEEQPEEKLITNPVVEAAIRKELKKPTGELTKADLEKVTKLDLSCLNFSKLINKKLTEVAQGLEKLTELERLHLETNQLTDVNGLEKLTQLTELDLGYNRLTVVPKGLEKLTQLTWLSLQGNLDLPNAQIDELKKALPKCDIRSDFD